MKKIMIALAMLMISVAGFAKKNIQTVVFTTIPQMHCESCENRIKGNLRFEKGIKKIETSVENQTVTIQYDANKTNVEKLQKGFEKLGYDARQLNDGEKVTATGEAQKCD